MIIIIAAAAATATTTTTTTTTTILLLLRMLLLFQVSPLLLLLVVRKSPCCGTQGCGTDARLAAECAWLRVSCRPSAKGLGRPFLCATNIIVAVRPKHSGNSHGTPRVSLTLWLWHCERRTPSSVRIPCKQGVVAMITIMHAPRPRKIRMFSWFVSGAGAEDRECTNSYRALPGVRACLERTWT